MAIGLTKAQQQVSELHATLRERYPDKNILVSSMAVELFDARLNCEVKIFSNTDGESFIYQLRVSADYKLVFDAVFQDRAILLDRIEQFMLVEL